MVLNKMTLKSFGKLTTKPRYGTFSPYQTSALSVQSGLVLTLLGGGAFGNEQSWIIEAIHRALSLYPDYGLEIAIVSYG
ncbi:MAG: hypothetical protein ACKODM_08965, partial [Cytophagales bacterium]